MKPNYIPLIIGISLPVIFISIISAVIFVPSFSIKPQHNFVYTITDKYYSDGQEYQNTYTVKDERIVSEPITSLASQKDIPEANKISAPIYLYNMETRSSYQITLEQAQAYILDPGPSSPDGYTIMYEYGHDGIFELFGSSNENRGFFISKDNRKKKLNGIAIGEYYNYSNFKFIGWIK